MGVKFTNNASTTITGAINNSVTTVTLADKTGFPSVAGADFFYATIQKVSNSTTTEVVKVTANPSGTDFTIERNASPSAFDANDIFAVRVTAEGLQDASLLQAGITTDSITTAAATVNGNITITGTVDGVNVSDAVTKAGNQTISGSKTFSGNNTFSSNVTVSGATALGTTTTGSISTTGTITASGEIEGGSLDINGNASIAGAVTDVTDLTASGTVTATGLNLADGAKATFGTGGEFTIEHQSGGSSVIKETHNTGQLYIQGAHIFFQTPAGGDYANFNNQGSVDLYWRGTSAGKRFETTQAGIEVTGEVKGDSLDIDGAVDINTSNGNVSINVGSGAFNIASNSVEITSSDNGATAIPVLALYKDSTSPVVNDIVGAVRFFGNNTGANNKKLMGGIECNYTGSITDGNSAFEERAKLSFHLPRGDGYIDSTASDNPVTSITGDITGDHTFMELDALALSVNTQEGLKFSGANDGVYFTIPAQSGGSLTISNFSTQAGNVNLPDRAGTIIVGERDGSGNLRLNESFIRDVELAPRTEVISTPHNPSNSSSLVMVKNRKYVNTYTVSSNTFVLPTGTNTGQMLTVVNASNKDLFVDRTTNSITIKKLVAESDPTSITSGNLTVKKGGVVEFVYSANTEVQCFGSGI